MTSINFDLMFVGGVIVPMCQSPKVADLLLRANAAALNNNDRPADKSLRPPQALGLFKSSWQYPVILICIVGFLVLELVRPP